MIGFQKNESVTLKFGSKTNLFAVKEFKTSKSCDKVNKVKQSNNINKFKAEQENKECKAMREFK